MGRDVDDRAGGPGGEEVADGGRATDDGQRDVGRDRVQDVAGGGVMDRGVLEPGGVIDPADQRPGQLGLTGGLDRDSLVGRVPNDTEQPVRGRVIGDPFEGVRMRVEGDDRVTIPEQPLDDRPADPAPTTGHHVRSRHAVLLHPAPDLRANPARSLPRRSAIGCYDGRHESMHRERRS